MRTLPKDCDLIDAVAEFLRSDQRGSAFLAQVAANALGIVRREIELRPAAEAATVARLTRILHRSGDAQTLERALAEAIADGKVSVETPGVREHLWASVMVQLEIDQPRYSTYLRAKEEGRPS